MKLLEYQARAIFEKFDIPVMNGVVIDSLEGIPEKIAEANLTYPVVIKVQVQIGGRGKAGGVKFANNAEEAVEIAKQLYHLNVRGYIANQLLIVEKANVAKEWYMSIMLDRNTKCPLLIFSPCGGMEIEQVAKETPDKVAKVAIDPLRGVQDYTIRYMMSSTGMDVNGEDKKYVGQLTEIVKKLYKAFFDYNTMLVEINPLGVTDDDTILALDGKVEVDDNAMQIGKLPDIVAFRDQLQEDQRVIDARQYGFHFIPIDDNGTVGIMSNGSGMMMSCLDLITKRGMVVGEGLDQGGGAVAEKLCEGVKIMFRNPAIKVLLVYIFGGITRCDEVCGGIKMALDQLPDDKRVVVRIEGTNKETAMEIIESMKDKVTAVDNVPEAVEALWKLHE